LNTSLFVAVAPLPDENLADSLTNLLP